MNKLSRRCVLSSLVATLLAQKAHIVLLQETLLTIATCYCNLRFYIFDMESKNTKTHNFCINNEHNKSATVGMTPNLFCAFSRALSRATNTRVVGNYLYDFTDQSKVYRVDITKDWNPVLISKSE